MLSRENHRAYCMEKCMVGERDIVTELLWIQYLE
jgi:hypothetical protein